MYLPTVSKCLPRLTVLCMRPVTPPPPLLLKRQSTRRCRNLRRHEFSKLKNGENAYIFDLELHYVSNPSHSVDVKCLINVSHPFLFAPEDIVASREGLDIVAEDIAGGHFNFHGGFFSAEIYPHQLPAGEHVGCRIPMSEP